jgi:hypothetical protein
MQMKRSSRVASRKLFAVAVEQGGYFTAKQAQEAGYHYSHLDYHVACDNFVRVGHGLYRLPTLPPAEHDDLIRWTLWSRNRQDQPQAVVSHESALVLHELSELLPTRTHLTVPPGFRKKAPAGCVLNKEAPPPSDVEERQITNQKKGYPWEAGRVRRTALKQKTGYRGGVPAKRDTVNRFGLLLN